MGRAQSYEGASGELLLRDTTKANSSQFLLVYGMDPSGNQPLERVHKFGPSKNMLMMMTRGDSRRHASANGKNLILILKL